MGAEGILRRQQMTPQNHIITEKFCFNPVERENVCPGWNGGIIRSLGLTDTHYYIRRRQWHPTPVLLPGKSHGRRSLVGCSPWGR